VRSCPNRSNRHEAWHAVVVQDVGDGRAASMRAYWLPYPSSARPYAMLARASEATFD
jgi:hypothetical protein